MKSLLIGCLLVASPANAATAILCNTTETTETKASATPLPSDTTKVVERSQTLIIDDVAKTFKYLNDKTGGLDTFCGDCQLEFGPSQIKTLRIGTNPKVHYWFEFKLDRVAGTVEHKSTYMNLDTFASTESTMTGTCSKTVMPKTSNAKAKF